MSTRRRSSATVTFAVALMGIVPFVVTVAGTRIADAQTASAPPAPSAVPSGPAWLGVATAPSPTGGAGVVVRRVLPQSPADRAGLRPGDGIVRVDGLSPADPADFTRKVRSHRLDAPVSLVVARDGSERTVVVRLEEAPSPEGLLRKAYVGAPRPPFAGIVPVYGQFPRNVEDLAGRVVVLEFWATWCGPCRLMRPVLDEWQNHYGAQGVTVLGISAEDTTLVASHGARTTPHYGLAADPDGETSGAYAISSLPTLFVIDKKGVIRDVSIGYDPDDLVRAERTIKALLAEPGAGAGPSPSSSPRSNKP